jgi:hypothetical protein
MEACAAAAFGSGGDVKAQQIRLSVRRNVGPLSHPRMYYNIVGKVKCQIVGERNYSGFSRWIQYVGPQSPVLLFMRGKMPTSSLSLITVLRVTPRA